MTASHGAEYIDSINMSIFKNNSVCHRLDKAVEWKQSIVSSLTLFTNISNGSDDGVICDYFWVRKS